MLRTQFVPTRSYRAIIYARMSSDKQNKRSPDQQIAVINELLKRLQSPWRIVAIYRDDGISGRYSRKRPGFRQMLSDLKTGAVKAQLILVDTLERLSRADTVDELKRKLMKKGVLVLTADSHFADPTTSAGRALAFVENVRATEDGRVKAHNVVRGKKDAIRQGHWPGGPVPFGFQLRLVLKMEKGVQKVDYSLLEPNPETRKIVVLIFHLAARRGWGGDRIANFLNDYERLPKDIGKFNGWTIAYILQNRLYYGELVWGANCTGIEDDVRVLQSLPEEEWEINSNFCKPIIPKHIFDIVERQRLARRRPRQAPEADPECNIIGLSPRGVALTYPLSGLVICGECGLTMIASSGGKYVSIAGHERRYTAYVCIGHRTGNCTNTCHVPEEWLREQVMNLIRERLFLVKPASK